MLSSALLSLSKRPVHGLLLCASLCFVVFVAMPSKPLSPPSSTTSQGIRIRVTRPAAGADDALTNGLWKATPPPATELCDQRRHGAALLVLLGPPTSGRTLENAIRNVAAPLCAWTVLVDVVDGAEACSRPPQQRARLSGSDADVKEEDALLARVAAAVEPAALRESLGPRLGMLGTARHLVSEDRRECGHIAHPPPPPRPLRHFGWVVNDGPCVDGVLPAAARDGAVTNFHRSGGVWHVSAGETGGEPIPGLSEVIQRVRNTTFGRSAEHEGETAVVDVRGAADFAVTGGLTGAEHVAAARFDGAQMAAGPLVSPVDPGDLAALIIGSVAHLDATGRDRTARRNPKTRFPVDPPTRFRPQNNVDDAGGDTPHPAELIRGTALNVTERPVPRLSSAVVLRRSCSSPAKSFCRGGAFATCVRRARWLAQLLITINEQDSFGDGLAFEKRGTGWAPVGTPPASDGDDALLTFPPPTQRIRPMPPKPSGPPSPPRCAASPSSSPNTDPQRRSLALLYAGQLRTGRTILPASLRQLNGNSATAFVAMGVTALDAAVLSDLEFFHRRIPLGALLLVNGTRSRTLRFDKREYPHERSWVTLPGLETISIAAQQHQVFAIATMMFMYEQRCDVRFDFIVRTRPDSLYRWPLPPSALPRLYPGVLVVDSGWDFQNGLSDQFAFGPAWLIGNFIDTVFLYPEMLASGLLPFTQAERIHRTALEMSTFPFARLVRPVRRIGFVVRDVHLRISAMLRQVLADLEVTLPPPCRPPAPMKIAFHAVPFVAGAPPCDASLHAPATNATALIP